MECLISSMFHSSHSFFRPSMQASGWPFRIAVRLISELDQVFGNNLGGLEHDSSVRYPSALSHLY